MRSSGWPSRARQRATRRFSPPERVEMMRSVSGALRFVRSDWARDSRFQPSRWLMRSMSSAALLESAGRLSYSVIMSMTS